MVSLDVRAPTTVPLLRSVRQRRIGRHCRRHGGVELIACERVHRVADCESPSPTRDDEAAGTMRSVEGVCLVEAVDCGRGGRDGEDLVLPPHGEGHVRLPVARRRVGRCTGGGERRAFSCQGHQSDSTKECKGGSHTDLCEIVLGVLAAMWVCRRRSFRTCPYTFPLPSHVPSKAAMHGISVLRVLHSSRSVDAKPAGRSTCAASDMELRALVAIATFI